jgi:hypothetical protein
MNKMNLRIITTKVRVVNKTGRRINSKGCLLLFTSDTVILFEIILRISKIK